MKKIISSILISAILFSCICVGAEETENRTPRQETYIEACGLLSALGVMTVTDKDYDTNVTRGEFASLVCKIYPPVSGTKLRDGEKMLFRDVEADSPYYNDILSLYAAGYMIGKTNRYFGTEDNLTLNEALKVLTVLLGYQPVADVKGGYTSGFYRIASDKGFLKGINIGGNDVMTREALAHLIKNTIMTDFMTVTSVGSDSATYGEEAGTSILNKIFDTFYLEGQITAIGETDIFGISDVDDGKIKVDRVPYEISKNISVKYSDLGTQGNFYIKKAKNQTYGSVIYYTPAEKRYKALTFNEDNYKDMEDVKINPSASVIYNSEYYGTYQSTAQSMLNPKNGNVTLVDSNNDRKYDVVVIRDLKYATVESVNYVILQAALGLGVKVNGKPTISNNDKNITIYRDGVKSDISAIGLNDLLEIEEASESGKVKITVVSGKISGYYTGYSKDSVFVDGTEYPASKNIMYYDKTGVKQSSAELETNCGFFRNSDGKVVIIITNAAELWQYGFLYQAKLVSDIDGDRILCRILAKNNSWLECETTNKTVVDGDKISDLNAILAKWKRTDGYVALLCRYKLDGQGKLTELDTAADPFAGSPTYPGANEDADSLVKVDYLSNFRADHTYGYNWAPDTVYKILDTTALCYVPTDLSDESYIKFMNNTEIVSLTYYDVSFYSPDEMMVARAALISSPGGETVSEETLTTNGFVITDISQCVDEKGEPTIKLKGIQAMNTYAEEAEYTVNAEAYKSSSFYNNIAPYTDDTLHRGAVIRFTVNNKNEILKVRIYFSCKKLPDKYYLSNNGVKFERNFSKIVSKDISRKMVLVQLADDPLGAAIPYKSYRLRGVVVYDSTNDEFRISDVSDADTDCEGFMFGSYGHPNLFFILK